MGAGMPIAGETLEYAPLGVPLVAKTTYKSKWMSCNSIGSIKIVVPIA